MTPLFTKPRESPFPLGFDPSKKCEHHFGAEGRTLEDCMHLRHQIQDLIDNKLIQFNHTAWPNVISNPLPPHPKENMNTISIVEERIPNFSSPSFPWKAMLRALAQESQLVLENIRAPGFN